MTKISLDEEKIRKLAKDLDNAIEQQDVERLVSYFSEECEVRLPGSTLTGHEGLRRAVKWMYSHLRGIVLLPVTIMVQGNVFFEEFTVRANVAGHDIEVRQSEVLVYDGNYKVTSLRLYFDRLELARHFPVNFIDRFLIGRVIRESLKDLAE
jgi:ketosteroid isomerase-like protein